MEIYWILFFIPLMCFVLQSSSVELQSKKWYYFIVFLYCLIGALRSESVGTDTPHYVDIIKGITYGNKVNLKALSSVYAMSNDPFFYWFYGHVYILFGHSLLGLFTFHTLLHWSLIGKAIQKHADNLFLALLVLIAFRFSDLYLNAMRQGISIAIVLFSYRFIINRQVKYFLFCMILATILHKSTLLFLPVYWLYGSKYINISKQYIFILIIAFFALKGVLFNQVFRYLFIGNQYELYLKVTYEHGILYYILYIVTFLLCLYGIDNTKKENIFLLFLCLCAVLLQTICLENPIFNRVSAIYSIYFVLLVPRVYSETTNKYKDMAQIITLLVFIFFVALYVLGGPAPGIVPFKSNLLNI